MMDFSRLLIPDFGPNQSEFAELQAQILADGVSDLAGVIADAATAGELNASQTANLAYLMQTAMQISKALDARTHG